MKNAAIYARTSTGHINDGLNRQIDHAKAYAAEQGWAVADEHIFVDAGPSGVQYEERPGSSRLMNVLKPRPPFHVLIMAEVSRLGRDQVKIAEALEQLDEAGARVGGDSERAIACAKTRAFEVPPEHIYVDDAISGAEFDRRPSLIRLLNAVRPRAPFAALFLADKDRLGREQFETNHILKQLSLAGVRIFEYQNGGQEVRLESPIDKILMSVSNFAAELERAKASQRTRDALQHKAQRGFVAGGTVFGYRNVPVAGDGGLRSHVIREVREDEAAIVRRIFELAGRGVGFRTIAQTLNADGVRSPRARLGR